MSLIHFTTKPFKIDSWLILRIPERASVKLPSRGMTLVDGTINAFPFKAVLDPDGKGSHWFRVPKSMQEAARAYSGNTVVVEIESSSDWPEPKVPEDLKKSLVSTPKARNLWKEITPMARWDWIRWIGSTNQADTRRRRVEVACSKLKAGERRPCCFNRTLCTEPSVSKNGVLLEPGQM